MVSPSQAYKVEITVTPQLPADDYDLEVYAPDGTLAGSSGDSPGQAKVDDPILCLPSTICTGGTTCGTTRNRHSRRAWHLFC